MGELENKIKTIAKENGAALVGITSRERLADAPPSGDPGYLLPSARSIISFAIPFNRKMLRDFFSKKDWLSWSLDKKENTKGLYIVSDHLVDFLRKKGFDAHIVDVNFDYRPEAEAKDWTELVALHPDFSHKYAAVAAGLGRLGWSGNLMTPQYGSAIQLGSVLTSAKLGSDPLLEENPCDRCKMCVAACPVGMRDNKEGFEETIAGITDEIAKRRTNNCCWIGCTGYHGLSPNRKWTNWSPYRVESSLVISDTEVDELCTRIRKVDPDAAADNLNVYSSFREAMFNPDYVYAYVCGNCANVCWENNKDRIENRKLLAKSGIVVLKANGDRAAVHDENEIVEIDTPYYMKVALLKSEYEAALRKEIHLNVENTKTLLDKSVLSRLQKLGSSAVE